MGERSNLELKVADHDPAASARACLLLGASDEGVLRQRDTYFAVRSGRLKLREDVDTSAAELVFYERADLAGVRPSRYLRVPVADATEVGEVLCTAVGVLGVVEKERRLFLFRNVRIHLDDVSGLGTFLELEAVLSSPSGVATRGELDALALVREALRLDGREAIPVGYLDLLGTATAAGAAPACGD
ncbi:MAG TPA: class IV adenylate cyclase [Gaiella sp.]